MDQQRVTVEQRESGRQDFSKNNTTFIRWKDKENKAIRFLTEADDIFFLKVHNFVTCLDGKPRSFICATEDERDCYLCAAEVKLQEIGYGIGVEREQLPGTTDYADVITTVDGVDQPVVGVITQAWNNFWKFIDQYYQKYGSLRDMDLDITRSGGGLQTGYTIIPNLPKPIADIDDVYNDYRPDLKAMLEHMVSETYYNLHLHGIKPETSDNSSTPAVDDEEEARSTYEALSARFGKK
jgi:hypothetical protein